MIQSLIFPELGTTQTNVSLSDDFPVSSFCFAKPTLLSTRSIADTICSPNFHDWKAPGTYSPFEYRELIPIQNKRKAIRKHSKNVTSFFFLLELIIFVESLQKTEPPPLQPTHDYPDATDESTQHHSILDNLS